VADASAREYLRRRTIVALWADAVLLTCTLLATRSPDLALYGLVAIAVIRLVGDRWSQRPVRR
jgi:hypothetical protein